MANLAIFYYSSTGTNYELAKWAEAAAKDAGADVKLRKIKELAPEEAIAQNPAWKQHYEAAKGVPEATTDDIEWADGMIFSVPTRFGNVPSQVKQFIDTAGGLRAQGKTVNKVVSAMSSAQNPHGGQEATILNLYTTMFHWGAIIASPGYINQELFAAGGNPYGVSVTVDQDNNMVEDVEKAVKHQARRTVEITDKIVMGNY